LLHLLDEGYVNDNLNNKISFTNSIVILTSNVGHDKKEKKSMGFINDNEEPETIYKDAVKKYLKPEFVARINNILVFNELSNKELESIVTVEIKTIQEKLKEKGIKISFHPSTKESILNKIKNDKLHARSIKDLVRSEFQVPISKFIIKNSKNQKISVKIVDNKLKIS
jgi:ATP-dependent Clp protease ATP-binding subunit ClpC